MRFFYRCNPRRKPFQGSPGRIKTYAATILSPGLLSRSRRLEGLVIAVLDDSQRHTERRAEVADRVLALAAS